MIDRPENMSKEDWQEILASALYVNRCAGALESTPPTSLKTGGDMKTEKGIREAVQKTIEILLEN